MVFYRSPIFDAEPYHESQGAALPHDAPSPVEFNAFYEHMERREGPERRLTLTKSKSGGGTLWPLRTVKRSATAPSTITGSSQPLQRPLQDTARHAEGPEMEQLEDKKEKFDNSSQMNLSSSIVPDTDLPAWFHKDIWASVPSPMYKASYRLHNPVGPRWYRNYHLIPPSQLRAGARPPSVFSPSFPPMGTTSMPERSLDSRLAGPSRTPSGSPLPTPSSSETRVADGAQKPRSRKPSLTTPDGVELDITDPWGTSWHHSSPYDFSISHSNSAGAVGSDVHRPRRASMTGYQIKRKAAPSPLSQSTSAVHLQPPATQNVLRKLSKRKTATLGAFFGGHSDDPKPNVISFPITSADNASTMHLDASDMSIGYSGVASSSASIMTKTSKKEKRGSVLGRLAKKFSLLKKSNNEGENTDGQDNWHHVTPEEGKHSQDVQMLTTVAGPSIGDGSHGPSPRLNEPVPHNDADRSSSISLEAAYPVGRLTVVNPDLPSSQSTPAGSEAPLPPERSEQPSPPSSTPNGATDSIHENTTQIPPRPLSSTALSPSSNPHSPFPTEPVIAPSAVHPPSEDGIDTEESLPPTPPAKSRAPSPALPPPATPTELILQDVTRNLQCPVSSPPASSTATIRPATAQPPPPSDVPISPSMSHAQSDMPFPVNDDSILDPPRTRYSYADSSTSSPFSTSSLVVNPPTPHLPRLSIPSTPEPPSHLPIIPEKGLIMNDTTSPTASLGQATRTHTGTFRLVRGTSGRVHGSTDTIVAAGQQWEVVETSDGTRIKPRPPSRKDQERENRDKAFEGSREKTEKERHMDQDQERYRARDPGANTREHSERRQEASHDGKEREKRREGSRDDRDNEKRRQAEEQDREIKRREAERERERMIREQERERERERQRLKELEQERERERQRIRELEQERERERQRLKELEQERERERQRLKELEREREKERQREKERERQRQRQREKEKEKEKERQKEREREKEKEREEREKERAERERARQKEMEREERHRQRERHREKEHRERAHQKEKEREGRERREWEQRHEKERSKDYRKDKDKDRRDPERRSRHSAEQPRAHAETQRHRTPSQSQTHHRQDQRHGSAPAPVPEPGSAETRNLQKRTDEGIKWPEQHEGESALNNPLPPLPTSTTRPTLQRNSSSVSTRPTSELPSAADLTALRAREAFEMERLFKARSMYGQEPDGAALHSISNLSDQDSSAGVVYGSSHTAYVLQTPFQNLHHSSNSPATQSRDAVHPERPFTYFNDLDLRSIPSLDSPASRPLSNPLPEPPRPSAYQPIPLAVLESGSTSGSDYWTKYTITTAH